MLPAVGCGISGQALKQSTSFWPVKAFPDLPVNHRAQRQPLKPARGVRHPLEPQPARGAPPPAPRPTQRHPCRRPEPDWAGRRRRPVAGLGHRADEGAPFGDL